MNQLVEQSTSPTVPVVIESAPKPATSWATVIQCRENTPLVKQRRFGPKNKQFIKTRKERTTNRPTPYKPKRDSREKSEQFLLRGLTTQQQSQGTNSGIQLQQPSTSNPQHITINNNITYNIQQPLQTSAYSLQQPFFPMNAHVYPYGYYWPQTMVYPQLYSYNVNHNQ